MTMPNVRRIRRPTRDEEPEDDRPRRRDRDDDERDRDDEPRSSRRDRDDDRPRRSRDERDDRDDERPSRRRDRDDRDDRDDERSARRRARDDDDDDEEERPARRRPRDDDDEEEDKVRHGRSSPVRSGWDGYKETKEKQGDFAEELRIEKGKKEIVKFLDDEPFADYRQHWIDNPPGGLKKKSWTCIEDDCPLCDLGDRPRVLSCFNVVHMTTGGEPENKILVEGIRATNQLKNFHDDDTTGPLSKRYYILSKSGEKGSSGFNATPIKERDLRDDYSIEPLDDDELRRARKGMYGADVIQVPTRKQLRELAKGLTDDD